MDLLAKRRNRARFRAAQKKAGPDGRVCAVYSSNGEPIYFAVPKDATDEQIRRLAFQAKHGRPMTRAEELLDAALNGDLLRAANEALANYVQEGRRETERWKALYEELKGTQLVTEHGAAD